MSDRPTLWMVPPVSGDETKTMTERYADAYVASWEPSRADLIKALGVEREWYCDRMDGSYYGPCPPPEEGEWEHEHWRYRHASCGWAYIVMEADGE